jgi:hypothetical protein
MAAGRQPLVLRLFITSQRWMYQNKMVTWYQLYIYLCNVLLVLTETELKFVPVITAVCSTKLADRPKEIFGTLAETDHWEFRGFATADCSVSVRPSAALCLDLFSTSTELTRLLEQSPPIRGVPDLSLGPTFLILIFLLDFPNPSQENARTVNQTRSYIWLRVYCVRQSSSFDAV